MSKNYRFLSDFTRIDATAFGSVDADVPVQALPGQAADEVATVKLRVWNVVLENLTPGEFILHHVMRLDKPLAQGQATMPAGVYDYTYKITVEGMRRCRKGSHRQSTSRAIVVEPLRQQWERRSKHNARWLR